MNRILSALISIIALPAIAFSQTFFELATDQTFDIESLQTNDSLFASVENNRSYCCQIYHIGPSNMVPRIDSLSVSGGSLVNSADRGRNSPWTGAGNNAVDSRKCFSFEGTESVSRTFITLDIEANATPIPNARVLCKETTLYGGFNTVVTDFNFIEITNTLTNTDINSEVVVKVIANGTIAGAEVLNTTITLQPGQRQDVNIHSSAANDFGPVILTHNGPQGSIRAVNAQYRIVTESPLDFEPVLSVAFREGL
jgi:hypothetical protein